MMIQGEWIKDGLFSPSCLAVTPAVALLIRLMYSPGFSLCLLVVHEHLSLTVGVTEAATHIKLTSKRCQFKDIFWMSLN